MNQEIQRKRIMIVDDAALNLKILSETLKDEYDVFLFSTGEDALSAVKGIRPDLFLLDVLMPGMDGYEVCRRLKGEEMTRSIPIIFLTALTEEMEETRGLAMGAVDYITKPISIPILLLRIKTQLQLIEQTRKLEETLRVLKSRSALPDEEREPQGYELKLAEDLHKNLMERPLPVSEMCQVYVHHHSHNIFGGDFYDYLLRREKDLGFFIADGSLQGIPAILSGSLMKILIDDYQETTDQPGELLRNLSNALVDTLGEQFITAFYGLLRSPSREFFYANAGHTRSLIFRCDSGMVEQLPKGGLPMGTIVAEMPYQTGVLQLHPGDRILMYTDGLTEGMDLDKPQEAAYLKEAFSRHIDRPLKEMTDNLVQDMEDLAVRMERERTDDLTVLSVEIL